MIQILITLQADSTGKQKQAEQEKQEAKQTIFELKANQKVLSSARLLILHINFLWNPRVLLSIIFLLLYGLKYVVFVAPYVLYLYHKVF